MGYYARGNKLLNGYYLLPNLKIERFFKDIKYRNNSCIGKFPNNKFNEFVTNCFNKPNKINLHNLYKYVLKDRNFDINNFIFKEEFLRDHRYLIETHLAQKKQIKLLKYNLIKSNVKRLY